MDNLKSALRSLVSTPGPSLVVVATLAIAIGANTAIFSVVNGVLLRPLYGDDERIVAIWATSGSDTFRLSPADYRDLRDGADGFGGQVALYRSMGSTLTGLERPVRIGSYFVTPRVFEVLGTKPGAGQLFTAADEIPGSAAKVVLTHASWVRRFGADPELVGTTIEVDGQPRTVLGITEPGFQFPPGDDEVEMYFPMAISDSVLLDRDHRMFDSIARLDDGVTLEAARSELDAIATQLAREFPDSNEGWGLTARPLREEMLGGLVTTLWVLSGAVFLVLLVACANIANVLIARSATASREFAVRSALGARLGDLCQRSLAESLLLGVLGLFGGVLLALAGGAWLRSILPADIPRANAVGLDGAAVAFAAVLSLGSTALFGLLPAVRSMSPDLLELVKPAGAFGGNRSGGRRLRELMVVVEVALAIVLLVGAGLMVRSFARLNDVDPGFRQQGVTSVAVQLPASRHARAEWAAFFEGLVDRVAELPGVQAVGATSDLPMSDVGLGFEQEFTRQGLDAIMPSARPNADIRLVIPGYFEAMGMEIVSGRDLDRLDTAARRSVAVVNETLVGRYFQDIDPIGRALSVASVGEVEIVGVVSDILNEGLQSKYESEIYLPYGRIGTAEMHIVVQSDLGTGSVASAVGAVLNDLDPELAPSAVAALSDLLWESVARPRFNTALLSLLALCAAVLAVVGTYGIVGYAVSQRTGEIGVRMALGADAQATVALIVRHALGILALGAALGVLGALGATRVMSQLLFDVQPNDPATYAGVVALAMLVGTMAAWIPALRATRIDPVVALRGE